MPTWAYWASFDFASLNTAVNWKYSVIQFLDSQGNPIQLFDQPLRLTQLPG